MLKYIQKYFTGLIIISLLITFFLLSFPLQAVEKGSLSKMNNHSVQLENINLNLVKIEGKGMAALRSLSERYDWTLYYQPKGKIVRINGQSTFAKLKINETEFNGYKLDNPPVIKNGKTYISPVLVGLLLREIKLGDSRQLETEVQEGNQGEKPSKQGEKEQIKNRFPDLLTDISLTKQSYKPGGEIKVTIIAYNISDDEVELKFNSGKSYDLYLFRGDKEVWHWSKGKFFTMIIRNKKLAPGEKVIYEVKDKLPENLKAGNYLLQGEISISPPLQLEKKEISIKK